MSKKLVDSQNSHNLDKHLYIYEKTIPKKEARSFFNNFEFATADDLNKCLRQIKLPNFSSSWHLWFTKLYKFHAWAKSKQFLTPLPLEAWESCRPCRWSESPRAPRAGWRGRRGSGSWSQSGSSGQRRTGSSPGRTRTFCKGNRYSLVTGCA